MKTDSTPEIRPAEAASSRRAFLISLGVGATAIAGWLVQTRMRVPAAGSDVSPAPVQPRPALADDVVLGEHLDMTTVSRPGVRASGVCAVNAQGDRVLRRIDGHRTVDEIAAAVADESGGPATDALRAGVALFVAQLAELGLLREPFYVAIVDRFEG